MSGKKNIALASKTEKGNFRSRGGSKGAREGAAYPTPYVLHRMQATPKSFLRNIKFKNLKTERNENLTKLIFLKNLGFSALLYSGMDRTHIPVKYAIASNF